MNSPLKSRFGMSKRSCDTSSQKGIRDAFVASSAAKLPWRRGVAHTICDEGVAATKGNS